MKFMFYIFFYIHVQRRIESARCKVYMSLVILMDFEGVLHFCNLVYQPVGQLVSLSVL